MNRIFLSLMFLFLSSCGWAQSEVAPAPSPEDNPVVLPGSLTSPEIEAIKNGGVLKIAVLRENLPPFFFRNKKDELEGIDISLAKTLALELGVRPVFVEVDSFDAVVEEVYQKRAHIGLSKLSVTTKRAEKIRYVGGYVTLSKALLVNRLEFKKLRNMGANTLEAAFKLPGVKIGVIGRSSYETFARILFPLATIKRYKKWDELVEATLNGEVVAAVRDEWEIRKALDERPDLPLYAEAIFLKNQNDPIKIAVAWDSLQLGNFIDTFMLLNEKYKFDVDKLLSTYKRYNKNAEK
ncbi:MAG: transporter substrate-binding domain-containing protein [Alphaproteobacteria bacterium]|nr:transporter substrate-binding domain-containing protein [Alphaproteobacteria bacterium]